jgi:hypothetical protein
MNFPAQSTDAENSKAAPAVSKPGDDLRVSSLGSAQTLAGTDRAATGGKGSQDAVAANVQGAD